VDTERVIVLDGNLEYVCHAQRNRVPFGDQDAAEEANKRKREEMKKMRELYRELTRPVQGLLEYSKTAKAAHKAKKDQERIDAEKAERERLRTEEELKAEEAALERKESFNQFLQRMGVEVMKPQDFGLIIDRVQHYAALQQHKVLLQKELSAENEAFMREFEAGLNEGGKKYWEEAAEYYRDLIQFFHKQNQKEGVEAL
jgi:hypothetical protein